MPQCYYKMQQLLQIATTLLQNATFITNCDSTDQNKSTTDFGNKTTLTIVATKLLMKMKFLPILATKRIITATILMIPTWIENIRKRHLELAIAW